MTPAVILVLVGCLSVLQAVTTQVRVQDAASSAARALARGDTTAGILAGLPGASITTSPSGDLLCAVVTAPATGIAGELAGVSVRASSCALDSGR